MNLDQCIERISVTHLQDFVREVIDKEYKDQEQTKLKDAIEVTKWLIFLLENDKILSEGTQTLATDLIITAALLHNVTYSYKKDPFYKLFMTRDLINDINSKREIQLPEQYIDAICQSIETQLGKDNECKLLTPNPNTPGNHVALACAIYYKAIK